MKQSSSSLRARRRAVLCAAVLAGGALAAAPASAAPSTPAGAAETAATASAPAPLAPADPNADGYDEFIVTYKQGPAAQTQNGRAKAWGKAAKEAGVSVKELRETALGSRVIRTDQKLSQAESAAFMEDLRASGVVDTVEPNAIITVAGLTPSDPLYPQQWGFTGTNGMRVPGAWDLSTGQGQVVAVIDTGITSHPDLAPNVVPGYDFITNTTASRDGDGRDANPQDQGDWFNAGECGQPQGQSSSWHGSHVAGTVAAAANTQGVVGVAPDARVQPVRALGKCGGSVADIADAIVWSAGGSVPGVPANATPADVINMSLGGTGTCTPSYQNAINAARSRGVPVVVAAGNENQPAANSMPANCSGVIAVGASTSNGERASYSNYGSVVDVTAPGSGIVSTVNTGTTTPVAAGYATMSGTSMATPHVAGLTALMLAKNPALSPDQVESALKANTRPMPVYCAPGCGTGLVDATKTLAAIGGSTTPIPDPDPVTPTTAFQNGGFESGNTGWTADPAAFLVNDPTNARSGAVYAAINGQGVTNTASFQQTFTVPASGAQLSYAVRVGTEEYPSGAYDTLAVQIVDGGTTRTVDTRSNLDAGGWTTRTVDLNAYAGRTVTLRFVGQEDYSNATLFGIDDVAVAAR